jgi:hypothetical protein
MHNGLKETVGRRLAAATWLVVIVAAVGAVGDGAVRSNWRRTASKNPQIIPTGSNGAVGALVAVALKPNIDNRPVTRAVSGFGAAAGRGALDTAACVVVTALRWSTAIGDAAAVGALLDNAAGADCVLNILFLAEAAEVVAVNAVALADVEAAAVLSSDTTAADERCEFPDSELDGRVVADSSDIAVPDGVAVGEVDVLVCAPDAAVPVADVGVVGSVVSVVPSVTAVPPPPGDV